MGDESKNVLQLIDSAGLLGCRIADSGNDVTAHHIIQAGLTSDALI